MKVTGTAVAVLGGVVAIGAIGFFLYRKSNAVVDALNPASDKNIVYGGVNAVGSALTGDGSFALGSWFYDQTHNEAGDTDYMAAVGGSFWALTPGLYGLDKIAGFSDMDYSFLNYVNPASEKNVVYSGVNKVGAVVSGDKEWSLGTWIYDITH